ncbi:hypothetical protein AB0P21_19785 [Kribbella sp. NPDC056861]|uniref:YobI family P-loop NTPase n=1 Tax=Kribbella sp. NPDC056861 TaxID=3154857 RepID=UPI0034479D04
MFRRDKQGAETGRQERSEPTLLPLTSSFDQEQHGSYVTHLEAALEDSSLRNIALTGNYGIGKSSILDEVRRKRRDKTLNLSLSTLGDVPPEPEPAAPAAEPMPLTNRIQKEIVKQLLYRELPTRVPHSRYRRLGKFRFGHEWVVTTVFVATVGILLILLGLMPPVLGSKSVHWLISGIGYAAVVLLASTLLTWGRMALSSRWSIDKFSAAGTSVSLARSETYFDKYLDEIVYFFEVTTTDVVIFEDIDRFDDPRIFETLRELNTLLNGTKQLEDQPIRFVYAIKDSIFEQIGRAVSIEQGADAADAELARANRTKFFDLVIPVIPFITHRSARDLMARTFEPTGVSTKLIDLVGKHLTDMRLIKNIYNEFMVFSGRLLGTTDGMPGLTADALLAMVVYKNIHLSDFEQISRGKSKLDELYRLSRQAVRETIDRLELRVLEIDKALRLGESEDKRAQQLGIALQAYLDRVARHWNPRYVLVDVRLDGRAFAVGEWGSPEFWQLLTSPGTPVGATIGYQGQPQNNIKCSVEDLREALGDDLDAEAWAVHDREKLSSEQDEARQLIEFVRYADLAGLCTRPQVTVEMEGENHPFEHAVEVTCASRLAAELVRAGYLDRNFTLYVSQYYGVRVSAAVTNYIVHNVQPGIIDMHYVFGGAGDIEALLEERGKGFLDEPSAYNIAVVDHLAARADQRLQPILTRLARFGDQERGFLDAYLQGGEHTEAFVEQLAGSWPGAYVYLARDAEVTDERRIALLSAALLGGSEHVDYEFADEFAQVVGESAGQMQTLTGLLDAGTAARVVSVLRRAALRFDDLSLLAPVLRQLAVEHNLYVFSVENLRAAMGGTGSLALDRVRATSLPAYQRCLDCLDRYVSLIKTDSGTPNSVEDPAEFTSILKELDGYGSAGSRELVVQWASPACLVMSVSVVPADAWRPLARHHRLLASFENVKAYLEHFDEVDPDLAVLITMAGTIVDSEAASDTDKNMVALFLLNAHETLPYASIRVAAVYSLNLESCLDPILITPEPGPLLGLLLKFRLVSDEVETFSRFADAGWPAIEAGIDCSSKFASFVSPELIGESLLAELFGSLLIDEQLKHQILSELEDYAPSGQAEGLLAAARFARNTSAVLTAGQLRLMAGAGAPADLLIPLLVAAEQSLTDADLSVVLGAFPEPYRRLAGSGGENFSVPNNEEHSQLLRRLRQQGVVKDYRKKRLDPGQLNVTMP